LRWEGEMWSMGLHANVRLAPAAAQG